ncbi:Rv3235 family protein [Streptomyces sp. SL13]|uniref:Rv3235 family protein n=1 Tax=Streptantibioticus silvisoli TaxID=2705255 RepID=A0AA90H7B6_9ACTN|nr:Rv3235 family protein [Streptantibioticus silvisoli]MDI5972556.1 Rv3235 family protein [Streptantibioticus silvisoli]
MSGTVSSTLTAPGRRPRPAHRGPGVTAPPGRRDTRRPGTGPRVPAVPDAAERRPHRWFADRLLDVLTGRHPVSRMLGHTAGPAAYDRLWELSVSGLLRPPAGRPTPRVSRCGFRTPAPGVRESWALLACGDTCRALAFRLEHGLDRRWRCAALDFTGPGW